MCPVDPRNPYGKSIVCGTSSPPAIGVGYENIYASFGNHSSGSHGTPPPAGWPAVCSAKYTPFQQYALNSSDAKLINTTVGVTEATCCSMCSGMKHGLFKRGCEGYTYYSASKTCILIEEARSTKADHHAMSGYNTGGSHKSSVTSNWMEAIVKRTKGGWYSFPGVGRCNATKDFNSPGCTWRVVETTKRVMKSCQDAWVEKSMEKINPACFAACPQPKNASTACFINCFYDALLGTAVRTNASAPGGLTGKQITDIWSAPFKSNDASKGGCPNVDF